MSVVGFDFGNLNCYISVARQGGIEVATNDYSLHATPSVVQFGAKCRSMGVPAKNSLMTNIRNTVYEFKSLVGRKFTDPVVQEEIRWLPFTCVQLDNDTLGIRVEIGGEQRVMTPEQVLAILLLKLKQSAEEFLKSKVYDCVIGVPHFWTDAQRRALLDAARICDLNVLRIINETTAVALAYGIYKQDLPAENEKPRLVAFVDVGHHATQASIVAFNKGKLKILATEFDTNFGGRVFDRLLREHFIAEFKSKFGVDAASQPKPFQRLLDECEKLKKLMSANSQSLPIAIECFMDDKDVRGAISRTEFEELAVNVWPRLNNLLIRLLEKAKVKPADLDSVEIVGGSSRVPRVKTILKDVFGKEPRTTLNQDEAVSRGAALQCAMLSPTFRVREFAVTDYQPYAIKVDWDGTAEADSGEMIVFNEGEPFPFSKMISFYRKQPFALRAYYAHPNAIPYPTAAISNFVVNNVSPDAEGGSSKVKVKVRINPNGLFLVSSASMLEKKPTDTVEQTAFEEMNGAEAEEEKAKEAAAEGRPSGDGSEGMDTNGQEAASETPPVEPEEKKPAKEEKKQSKPKIKSVDLPITENVQQLSNVTLENMRSLERNMRVADRAEKEKADAKNTLESYVYEMRDKLGDGAPYAQFAAPAESEVLLGQLSSTEDWIYDEGEDCDKAVYEGRLADLRKLGDPIVERAEEAKLRGPAWQALRECMVRVRKFCDAHAAGDEKYGHVGADEVDKVRKLLVEKEAWADRNEGAQHSRDPTQPPVVFASQIKAEMDALERVAKPVMSKPKPKVEPPPSKEPPPAKSPEGEPHAAADNPAPSNGTSDSQPHMEVD